MERDSDHISKEVLRCCQSADESAKASIPQEKVDFLLKGIPVKDGSGYYRQGIIANEGERKMNKKMIAKELVKIAKSILAEDGKTRFYVYDILWDVDEDLLRAGYELNDKDYLEAVKKLDLPESVYVDVLDADYAEDEIQDYLEDEFGYCVKEFQYEEAR